MLNAALAAVAVSANTTFVIMNPLDPYVMSAVEASNSMWREVGIKKYIERSRRLRKAGSGRE
jgi:hypothetical protein